MSDSTRHKTAPQDRIPLGQKIRYGIGGITNQLGTNALKEMAYPVYQITFGLNPVLVGLTLSGARLWDAFTDPMMGSVSDNCRSRHGRRRPFIFLGAILCALAFPLLWLAPASWGETGVLGYFIASSLVFYTCFTIYAVPYFTLGYEMTPDYHERSRLMAVRQMLNSVAILLLPGVFFLAQLSFFDSTISGIRWISLLIAILILVTGLIPVIGTRERFQNLGQKQPRQPFFGSLAGTLRNRNFLILIVTVIGSVVGTQTVQSMGVYINIYYVKAGDTAAGAGWAWASGAVFGVVNFLGAYLIGYGATVYGKVRMLQLSIGLGLVGSVSTWFFYTPNAPGLQLLSVGFLGAANSGFWTLISSLKADVCDEDELQHGIRREGMFGAVASWLQKFSVAFTFTLTGLVLWVTGFDEALGAAQPEGTITKMRLLYAGVPAVANVLVLALLLRYKLTEKRMYEIRDELEARRNPV